jgi:anthranilate 1,2-dioxygenase small subunit
MKLLKLSKPELLHAVMALQAEYAEVVDSDRLEEWPGLFGVDATYRVLPRENADRGLSISTIYCSSRAMLEDRVVSLRKANIFPVHHYRHILSIPFITSVDAEEDVILARTNYVVFQTRNDGKTEIYNAGYYDDLIFWDEDRIRFASKTAIFDTNRVDTMMAKPI